MILKSINFSLKNDVMKIDCVDGNLCAAVEKITSIAENFVVLVDSNVFDLHLNYLQKLFDEIVCKGVFRVASIEKNKSINYLEEILDYCVEKKIDRSSAVIAIGGGLTGNIAGMAAGILYRGIKLIHIPTTFLAMSDSILSAKQAVNGEASKNIYGLYHNPSYCIIDFKFLDTLPQEQFVSGVVELFKNSLVFDVESIDECLGYSIKIKKLIDNNIPLKNLHIDDKINMTVLGINGKQKFLQDDLKEKGAGLVLEYGHTLGHALELESDGKIPHGISVGVGMLVAAKIALNRGYIDEHDYQLHKNLLKNIGSVYVFPKNINKASLLERMEKDNKRGYIQLKNNEYPFIILEEIGKAVVKNGIPLIAVSKSEVVQAMNAL